MLSISEERALRKIQETINTSLTKFEIQEQLPDLMIDFMCIMELHINVTVNPDTGMYICLILPACSVTNNEPIVFRTKNIADVVFLVTEKNLPVNVENALPEYREGLRDLFKSRNFRFWEQRVRMK